MALKGQLGDCDLLVTLVDNLREGEQDLDGRARKRQKVQLVEVEIEIDSGLEGRALLNTLLHEILHLCEYVYGWNTKHHEVWLLAAGLSQALLSTGIVDATQLEARIRTLSERVEDEK